MRRTAGRKGDQTQRGEFVCGGRGRVNFHIGYSIRQRSASVAGPGATRNRR